MKIDTTFLRPHPATLAWWAARDACRTCSHHMPPAVFGDGERCRRLQRPIGGGGYGRRIHPYCIDARDEGAECGPAASLRRPVKGTEP